MPFAQSLEPFDRCWAAFLGCTVEDLRGSRTVVVPHGSGPNGFPGIWAFRLTGGRSCVVSVPPPMERPLSPLVERHAPEEFFDRQFLLDALRHPVESIVGPVALGFTDGAAPCWQTRLPNLRALKGFREYATYFVVRLKPTWP